MYSEERGTTKLAQIKEQEIFVNPYVVQMDKFADSLQHLSKTFLNMEAYKGTLSREEIDEMFEKISGSDYTPVSFVSADNKDIGLVQFAIRTDDIKK